MTRHYFRPDWFTQGDIISVRRAPYEVPDRTLTDRDLLLYVVRELYHRRSLVLLCETASEATYLRRLMGDELGRRRGLRITSDLNEPSTSTRKRLIRQDRRMIYWAAGAWISLLFLALAAGVASKSILAPLLFLGIAAIVLLVWVARTVIPGRITLPEEGLQRRARRTAAAARDFVRRAPISNERKAAILAQIRTVPPNIHASRVKLQRLRKLQVLHMLYKGPPDEQLMALETKLLAAMHEALDLLLAVPKSIMMVESAREERRGADILTELRETNQRLADLAAAHTELYQASQSRLDEAKQRLDEPGAGQAELAGQRRPPGRNRLSGAR